MSKIYSMQYYWKPNRNGPLTDRTESALQLSFLFLLIASDLCLPVLRFASDYWTQLYTRLSITKWLNLLIVRLECIAVQCSGFERCLSASTLSLTPAGPVPSKSADEFLMYYNCYTVYYMYYTFVLDIHKFTLFYTVHIFNLFYTVWVLHIDTVLLLVSVLNKYCNVLYRRSLVPMRHAT